ncbi:DUF4335 domain-containing protein [Geitlerinema sp. PCC 7407]|uniref:DUF4335 domain-containing protein n=1 Tax=Geitlerinema sp. PCC 7407 TaxID=1173025 RepID=UPI00029FB18E|nr:DUF4335 domain-containing protein [Geitlerinema sp. PCC 7407]AFY66965.1 hypothetical protein GEI7407_2490 [Geitlerinema sp. PCC 7407]
MQRQYSLPNCKLVLEGIEDIPAEGALDPRPPINVLVNAECHIQGHEQPLSGGRTFFEGLVNAVNHYAQSFFSSVSAPESRRGKASPVTIERLDQNRHRIVIHPEAMSSEEAAAARTGPLEMDLTTVQLFDLVEAVDQFFADSRTLPDLSCQLQPVSRKHAKAERPLQERALPAAVGISGLAAAAVAVFLLPIPNLERPRDPAAQSRNGNNPNETSAAQAGQTGQPDSEELAAMIASAREIVDPNQLNALRQSLYDTIDQAWSEEPEFSEPLSYKVSVGEDGAVLGYDGMDLVSDESVNQTPLLDLVYIPPEGGVAPRETIALFKVVFRPSGVLEVSPWRGFRSPPSDGPTIDDPAQIEELTGSVYDQINNAWDEEPSFEQDLVFRVGVTSEGKIAEYEAVNQPARDYGQEIPLPSLVERSPSSSTAAETATTEASTVPPVPLAQFKVVFTSRGVLQVNPWDGYPDS